MKYLKQLCIILAFSFAGEILNKLIPFPVPASIYGIILLFVCLETKVITLSSVKETGDFLLEIMPVLFIPAAVGLISMWDIIKPSLLKFTAVTVVSTIVVMTVSGKITQCIRKAAETDE